MQSATVDLRLVPGLPDLRGIGLWALAVASSFIRINQGALARVIEWREPDLVLFATSLLRVVLVRFEPLG
jgi:hypothetical protein